jgi:hypothetical protein
MKTHGARRSDFSRVLIAPVCSLSAAFKYSEEAANCGGQQKPRLKGIRLRASARRLFLALDANP